MTAAGQIDLLNNFEDHKKSDNLAENEADVHEDMEQEI